MKLTNIVFLLSFITLVNIPNYSRTLVNSTSFQVIDTLYIFPAIGVIKCPQGKRILPSDSLNNIFQEKLTELLPSTAKFKVDYLGPDMDLNDSLKSYFIKTIPKFSNITTETFSIIPLGESFNEMIKDVPGRYFGIIFYDGFVQHNIGAQIGKAIAIGLATAVLTGGLFSVYPVPQESTLYSEILILDKETNNFLFYSGNIHNGSPLESEGLTKYFSKVFNKYK